MRFGVRGKQPELGYERAENAFESLQRFRRRTAIPSPHPHTPPSPPPAPQASQPKARALQSFQSTAYIHSSLAPLACTNECRRGCQATARQCPTRCKRRHQATAQKSATHRRVGGAPRVLARVSIRREAAAGGFPESLQPQPLLCSQCIGRDEKSR